jgi:hypothetical protein
MLNYRPIQISLPENLSQLSLRFQRSSWVQEDAFFAGSTPVLFCCERVSWIYKDMLGKCWAEAA